LIPRGLVWRVCITVADVLPTRGGGIELSKNLFWLDDLQWASIEPYIPSRKQRGPRRVPDRRIISGIIHVLQSGCRWRDCPSEYGPATTVYNRFLRWSKKGVWEKIFLELSGIVGTHYENMSRF
jgi:hypothetical protein